MTCPSDMPRSVLIESDDTRFDRTVRHKRQARARYGWAGFMAKVEAGRYCSFGLR